MVQLLPAPRSPDCRRGTSWIHWLAPVTLTHCLVAEIPARAAKEKTHPGFFSPAGFWGEGRLGPWTQTTFDDGIDLAWLFLLVPLTIKNYYLGQAYTRQDGKRHICLCFFSVVCKFFNISSSLFFSFLGACSSFPRPPVGTSRREYAAARRRKPDNIRHLTAQHGQSRSQGYVTCPGLIIYY